MSKCENGHELPANQPFCGTCGAPAAALPQTDDSVEVMPRQPPTTSSAASTEITGGSADGVMAEQTPFRRHWRATAVVVVCLLGASIAVASLTKGQSIEERYLSALADGGFSVPGAFDDEGEAVRHAEALCAALDAGSQEPVGDAADEIAIEIYCEDHSAEFRLREDAYLSELAAENVAIPGVYPTEAAAISSAENLCSGIESGDESAVGPVEARIAVKYFCEEHLADFRLRQWRQSDLDQIVRQSAASQATLPIAGEEVILKIADFVAIRNGDLVVDAPGETGASAFAAAGGFEMLEEIFDLIGLPSGTIARIEASTGLTGVQTEARDEFKVTFSYNGSAGLSIILDGVDFSNDLMPPPNREALLRLAAYDEISLHEDRAYVSLLAVELAFIDLGRYGFDSSPLGRALHLAVFPSCVDLMSGKAADDPRVQERLTTVVGAWWDKLAGLDRSSRETLMGALIKDAADHGRSICPDAAGAISQASQAAAASVMSGA